jgi:hypothetical protein
MERRILLRYYEVDSSESGHLIFYEDGTYKPLDCLNELSKWKLVDDVLWFKHPGMLEFKTPWSADLEKTKNLTDVIQAELFLKELLEK